MKPTEIIGSNIKTIREQKGIKQEVLAKYINISKGRMSQIEKGDCEELTINRINKIANYLQTDFFEITGNHPQHKNMNDNTDQIGFNDSNFKVSDEFIKALAEELVNRMNK